LKNPAKVGKTTGTDGKSPGKALEPGKFIGWRAACQAARSFGKTADLIDNPGRIEKGVLMGTVYFYTILFAGDLMTAVGTAN